jgi:hypothetical protein
VASGRLDGEALKGDDLKRGPLPGRNRPANLAQHGGPLLGGEHGRLAGMNADGNHEPIDEPKSVPHHIDVAEGHGIEAACVEGCAGHAPR